MDSTIRLWDASTGRLIRVLSAGAGEVYSLAFYGSRWLASGHEDGSVRLWDVTSGELHRKLDLHRYGVNTLSWSRDGQRLASGSYDGSLGIWSQNGDIIRCIPGEFGSLHTVAWSGDDQGRRLAAGYDDGAIRLWDSETGRETARLEGHTAMISRVAFSPGGRFLASKSKDDTVRLWDCSNLRTVSIIPEPAAREGWHGGVVFHPTEFFLLATLGQKDSVIRIWQLDRDALAGAFQDYDTIHYRNARVVLVGDSGVGKSALASALRKVAFSPTHSTHGRHVYNLFEDEILHHDDRRIETREAILWDLAGQPGYRIVHQLYLKEIAVALVVFDAQSDTDPFSGVRYWDRALRQAQRVRGASTIPLKKFLVAARTDRGSIGASPGRLKSFCDELGFDGFFITSAKEGIGIHDLLDNVRKAINWNILPRISSTKLFGTIQEFLLLERRPRRWLGSVSTLFAGFTKSAAFQCYQGTQAASASEVDLRANFETCLALLESRGIIRRLSFGNFVLLRPELLDAYASAMINAAKDEPDGFGCIAEESARTGHFTRPADTRVSPGREAVLLTASIEEMLAHELAMREHTNYGAQLVFPSQFNRERSDLPEPEGKTLTFIFEGPLLNIYVTLAVRLCHSGSFEKKGMWKNASTYSSKYEGTYGLYFREIEEGRGELGIFYDDKTNEPARIQFEDYVRSHLEKYAVQNSVQHRKVYRCTNCGFVVTEQLVSLLEKQNRRDLHCPVCGPRITIVLHDHIRDNAPAGVAEIDVNADRERDFGSWIVSTIAESHAPRFSRWARNLTEITLAFTDILGPSINAAVFQGEEPGEYKEIHFEMVRSLIRQFRGLEINHFDNSILAAFDTAAGALDFSLALRGNDESNHVQVRTGIHVTGVPAVQADEFSRSLQEVAWIAGMASGAEILLSDAAYKSITFRPDSERRIKQLKCSIGPLRCGGERQPLWSVARTDQGVPEDPSLKQKIADGDFDVFLCHNSQDKALINDIYERLLRRGILPWLDEKELRPGLPWQTGLEQQIEKIRAAAVFIGPSGVGPWQHHELRAFLIQFSQRGGTVPIIPVFLPGAPPDIKMPVFLQDMTKVDFNKTLPDPLDRLVFGITGQRPSPS